MVIDDDEITLSNIETHFKNHPFIKIYQTISISEEIYKYLKNEPDIDIIVLDLIMPNIDGLDVLKMINKLRLDVKTIVLTSFNCPNMISLTAKLGVDYYLLKPFTLIKLEQVIIELKTITHHHYNYKIDNYLLRLGVMSKLKGFDYIKTAILLYKERFLIEDIYKIISAANLTNEYNVESAIRYAIKIGLDQGDMYFIKEIFGYSISCNNYIPSNYVFIKTLSNFYWNNYVNVDNK